MLQEELNRVFQNRITTFEDYIEMYGDDIEKIDIYIYDFIAYALAKNNKKNPNNNFTKLFTELLRNMDDNNEISIIGMELKTLYYFTKENGITKDLEAELINLYKLNEEKREINYKINYKYYNNENQYMKLQKTNKEIERMINNKIKNIYKLNNKENLKYDYNYDYEYEMDESQNKKKH